jgi:hypothetical protein
MELWRQKAINYFPDLEQELLDEDYSYYMVFFDLLDLLKIHRRGNKNDLEHLYEYAEWCLTQSDDDIINAVRVAFYEHLFDEREDWERVIPWLSKDVIESCWPLWEERYDDDKIEELRRFLRHKSSQEY